MEHRPLRVLIVDDSNVSCSVLEVILRSEDIEIVGIANDAPSGLAMALETKPDVVMLDIVMEGVSGLEAIRPIKNVVEHVIIIMISVIDDNEMITCAIQLGADGYVVKPFDSTSVIRTIRKVKERFVLSGAIPKPARHKVDFAERNLPRDQKIVPFKL